MLKSPVMDKEEGQEEVDISLDSEEVAYTSEESDDDGYTSNQNAS